MAEFVLRPAFRNWIVSYQIYKTTYVFRSRFTPGFPAEIISRNTKTEMYKYLEWESMEGLENHEQLVCTNHNMVYKSEVVPAP